MDMLESYSARGSIWILGIIMARGRFLSRINGPVPRSSDDTNSTLAQVARCTARHPGFYSSFLFPRVRSPLLLLAASCVHLFHPFFIASKLYSYLHSLSGDGATLL